MIETRYRYELVEQPPEGWRFMHNEFNSRGSYALYDNGKDWQHGRQLRWFELRQIVQERTVTEWVDRD